VSLSSTEIAKALHAARCVGRALIVWAKHTLCAHAAHCVGKAFIGWACNALCGHNILHGSCLIRSGQVYPGLGAPGGISNYALDARENG